jgi:hypothetical protein
MSVTAVISGACPGCCTDDICTVGYDPYLVGNNTDWYDLFDIAGECTNGMTLSLHLKAQTDPDEVSFHADGVEFFSTGCLSGDSDHTINVPPGTKALEIFIDNTCGSYSEFWLIFLSCENIAP